MTIQSFYKNVLSGLSYRVLEDDLITFMAPDGQSMPATVDGLRMVMPTKERLRKGFFDEKGELELQPFHPLSESISRKGTSPVLQHMQRAASALIAHAFVETSRRLLEVAADPALHKDLPPSCSEYLKKVSKADKKCVEVFDTLMEKAFKQKSMLVVYLKNGGKHQGEKVNRLCVIHFPIIDLIDDSSNETPLGVKMRKKDREIISAIFHHVMPFGGDPEYYSAGSNSRIAPYFDCFMKAYANVAKQLNVIIKRYAKHIDLSLNEFDLSYMKEMDDLGQFYNQIPHLRGNEGGVERDAPEEPTPSKVSDAPTAQPAPTRAVQQPSKPTTDHPAGLSVKDFLTTIRPPAPQYPTQPQQQQQQPYGGYQHPQYGAYNAYGQPAQDPRQPSWLVGQVQQQAPQQPQSPFAQALMQGQPAPQVSPYGGGYAQPYQQPVQQQYGGYAQPQQPQVSTPYGVL